MDVQKVQYPKASVSFSNLLQNINALRKKNRNVHIFRPLQCKIRKQVGIQKV